jgi:hypothetical protein
MKTHRWKDIQEKAFTREQIADTDRQIHDEVLDMKALATLKCGSLTFTAELPATRVPESENPVFDGPDVQRFEREAAKWVIANAAISPDTFRLLRGAADLTKAHLAELLIDCDEDVISHWEDGEGVASDPPMLPFWHIVASLATDAMAGETTTRDWLKRARQAPPAGQVVKLKLP